MSDTRDRKLFIGGLNHDTVEETLGRYFQQWGEVTDCVIMKDNSGSSRGFGFITYKEPYQLQDAQRIKVHVIDNKEVDAKLAVPKDFEQVDTNREQVRKLFVGGLNYETNVEGLQRYFAKFGEVVDCNVMKDGDGRSRGFGFVTYSDISHLDEAQRRRPHTIDGKEVETKRAMPKDSGENNMTVKKMFVGGLKEDTTEEMITQVFSEYGQIENVDILKDKSNGRPRGFCFVVFDDYDSVDRAVLKKRHDCNGVKVEVRKAVGRDQMASRGPGPRGFDSPRGRWMGGPSRQFSNARGRFERGGGDGFGNYGGRGGGSRRGGYDNDNFGGFPGGGRGGFNNFRDGGNFGDYGRGGFGGGYNRDGGSGNFGGSGGGGGNFGGSGGSGNFGGSGGSGNFGGSGGGGSYGGDSFGSGSGGNYGGTGGGSNNYSGSGSGGNYGGSGSGGFNNNFGGSNASGGFNSYDGNSGSGGSQQNWSGSGGYNDNGNNWSGNSGGSSSGGAFGNSYNNDFSGGPLKAGGGYTSRAQGPYGGGYGSGGNRGNNNSGSGGQGRGW